MDSTSSDEGSPRYMFTRMDSEVIEKPSYHNQYDQQFEPTSSNSGCDSEVDLEMLLSENSEVFLDSSSPHSSVKGDVDGSPVSRIDELDEGFEEDFFENEEIKDPDVWDSSVIPTFSSLSELDLNDRDLQHILMEQTVMPLSNTALLEELDLGVDVLESEQAFTNSVNVSISSPVPSSPYQLGSVSSPASVARNMSQQQINSQVHEDSFYQPNTSLSWNNPTLSSVNMLDVIDINDISGLMTNVLNEHINLPYSCDTSLNSTFGTTQNTSTFMQLSQDTTNNVINSSTRVSRSLSPVPPSPSHSYQSVLTPSGACYVPRSPSPAESARSPASSYSASSSYDFSTVSFSPAQGDGEKLTNDEQKYVSLPYYKFKKLLDGDSVSDDFKEKLKVIRKRGKNKVAAKNCRQKKLSMINGLQHEINQLKEHKAKLSKKTKSLEQEIAILKQRCSRKTLLGGE